MEATSVDQKTGWNPNQRGDPGKGMPIPPYTDLENPQSKNLRRPTSAQICR